MLYVAIAYNIEMFGCFIVRLTGISLVVHACRLNAGSSRFGRLAYVGNISGPIRLP